MGKKKLKEKSIVKPIILFLLFFIVFLFFSTFVEGVRVYSKGPSLLENTTLEQNLTDVGKGSLNLGDIDNDGWLDLVLTGYGTSITTKVYKYNGTSFRENKTWQQNLTGVYRSSTAFGDIDNDGDLDLILLGCNEINSDNCPVGSKFTKVYENNGTSFRENKTWEQNLTAIYWGAVAFGDIDNDGRLDLVLSGGATTGRISKVYINNGTSFRENKEWQQNLTNADQSMSVLGDIDNDGDLDLILTGRDSNLNKFSKVYLNNGTSLIENKKWYNSLQVVKEGALVLMDFDNDGDLDLDLTGCCDYNRLYHNNGTSFILNQSEALGSEDLPSSFDGSVSFGDYDNDGDLDIAVTGREGKSYIFNNNRTHFDWVRYKIDLRDLMWSTILWGDVDNDTDLDLIQTGGTVTTLYSEVYTNNATITNTKPTPPKQFTNYTTPSGNIHIGWGNGSDSETPSNGLYYNIRVGSSSGDNQIISGKYGGGEDNGYFGNMMQRKNITLKNTRLQPNTQYFWSVQTIDTALKASSWSTEQDFTTLGDLTPPIITLNKPVNYYNSSKFSVLFNATVYDNVNVTNVTLYGNWSGAWVINFTNSSFINNSEFLVTVNLGQEGDGFYKWGIKSCDNSSLCSVSDNRTLLVDTHWPNVSLMSPANNSVLISAGVVFNYNVTDKAISNCSLILNDEVDQTDNIVVIGAEQRFDKTLVNGNYEWFVNCTDTTNHTNSSMVRSFTVEVSSGSVSHGGSSLVIPKQEVVPIEKKATKSEIIKEREAPEVRKSRIAIIFGIIRAFFETIYAFIVSLLTILAYVWIVREDFPKK